jgi:DNA-binding MarR family transcriptional regulator
MNTLPPSSKTVLRILGTGDAMSHKDIVLKSHCSPRTVRYALKRLQEHELIVQKMNMRDMRQIMYQNRKAALQKCGGADFRSGSM